MNKREIIKQKQKLKKTEDFKLIRYARMMCVALVVIFLAYTYLLSLQVEGGMTALLQTNLFVISGFSVALLNLIFWYEMKNILKAMDELRDIEASKVRLLIIAITELVMFNYATAALVFLALYKYFRRQGVNVTFTQIKETHQLTNVITISIVSVFFIALTYFMIFAALSA